jgi:hypothetical protein
MRGAPAHLISSYFKTGTLLSMSLTNIFAVVYCITERNDFEMSGIEMNIIIIKFATTIHENPSTDSVHTIRSFHKINQDGSRKAAATT